MINYDSTFLNLLDSLKVKKQYIEITILSFDEQEVRSITGSIVSGSISVNGSSRIRRTINLSMIAQKYENDLTNLDNLISLNKKIRVSIGYENPFKQYQEQYGKIAWFPCGVYVISQASINTTPTSCNISLQGKDKMAMLDGTAGGTLPASVSFNDIYQENDDGTITILQPTIFQIIQECVNHYGKEPINNIIISDIPDTGKKLVRYKGNIPIHFNRDYSSFVIQNTAQWTDEHQYSYGDDIGYQIVPFTYPDELVFAAGSTVMQILDKICQVLGNYEFFYDTEGHFVFQLVKDYTLQKYTPLTEIDGLQYIRTFAESQYQQFFTDSQGITAFNNNPQYSNIRNDFIVWGQRESVSGSKHEIRYHLAIDEKPSYELCQYDMYEILDHDTGKLVRYGFSNGNHRPPLNPGEECGSKIASAIPASQFEWREELYRRALLNSVTVGLNEEYYDAELIAEWRKIYSPDGEWLIDIVKNPQDLDYWLDFIDNSSELGQYSINAIGRRTKVINDTNIKTIYNKEIPDIVFIENDDDVSEEIAYCGNIGQPYCLIQPNQLQYFSISTTGVSCYEKIRELIDIYLTYNTSITITSLPRYYLEPNTLIYVKDTQSGIEGSFVISQFNLPLQYSSTMNITAIEAITRV